MTLSTSPTSDGSNALVGSSNSSTSGSIVSARAIATRWRWPPDNRDGYSSRFSLRPDLGQVRLGQFGRLLAGASPSRGPAPR